MNSDKDEVSAAEESSCMSQDVPTYAEYRVKLQSQMSQSGVKLDEQHMHDSYMRTLARDTLLAINQQVELSKRMQASSRWLSIMVGVLFLLLVFGGISIVLR